MPTKQQLYNRLTTEVSQNMADVAALGNENSLKNQAISEKNQAIIAKVNAEDKAKELEIENARLRNLLSKPMEEIAAKNGNFAETYRKQQELIADWIVSQKAFKELAIEFGLEKGLSVDEVVQKGINKKIDVLENKHNESHKTNSSDTTIVPQHKESLIKKIKGK